MSKFNGWQRIWIVLSILWLLAVVGVAATMFPTDAKQLDIARSADEEFFRMFYKPKSGNCFELSGAKAIETCLADKKTDFEFVRDKKSQQDRKSALEVEENGWKPQAIFVGQAFAIWLVPAICVYLLGIGVAWVRRGFNRMA